MRTIRGSVGDALHMNVSLTPELEQYVNGKVQSGLYHSASEVVREGLRLLREKDEIHQKKLQALRSDIQAGIDQMERGGLLLWATRRSKKSRSEGRKRLAAERKSKSR